MWMVDVELKNKYIYIYFLKLVNKNRSTMDYKLTRKSKNIHKLNLCIQ